MLVARIVERLARFSTGRLARRAALTAALAGCGNLPYLPPEPPGLGRPAEPGGGNAAAPAAGDSSSAGATTGAATGEPAATAAATIVARTGARTGAATGEAASLSVDRIAYISPYGDLFTVNPDGSGERRLTGGSQVQLPRPPQSPQPGPGDPPDASDPAGVHRVQDLDFNNVYAWPTWSPDGTRLAVSRVQIAGNRSLQVSVQVLDAATGRGRMVYENDVPALVADGAPHYLYWSPDGEYLSFLAATRQGLTLFAVNPDTVEGAVALERGAPLYYSWGGDGDSLMVHSRGAVKLLRQPFRPDRARLLVNTAAFRTPALSPDGRRWAYTVSGPASGVPGSTLYVGEVDDPAAPRQILEVGPFSAFIWSPDGSTLAVADRQGDRGSVFQRIRLVTGAGVRTPVRTLVEEPLLAFYWAPSGERLAWVAVDAEEQVFEWKVAALDAAAPAGGSPAGAGAPGNGAAVRELFRFRPSGEVFTMLSFFDQYAYSHSPWSPDGSRLVVAGSPGPVAERRNGHTPTGARVYVLDAVGDAPPTELAAGSVAFWSWN